MSWMRGLSERVRVLVRFSRVESDLDRELRDHLEREVERQLQDDVSPAEARRRASLRVGNLESLKERTRDERGGRLISDALGDLRIGWRSLRRTPGFTLAVAFSVALGVAGTAGIFSVVNAVLLRPLPYPDADRLHLTRVAWNDFSASLSPADFLSLREHAAGVGTVGAFWNTGELTMELGSGPELIRGASVTSDLPQVLGIAPVLGRLLSDDPGVQEVLISTDLWQSRFGGARDVIGRGMTLDGRGYTIVGVMPPGYDVPGEADGAAWIGGAMNEPTRRGPFFLSVLTRLDVGLSAETAGARLTTAITPLLHDRYGVDPGWRYRLLPVKEVLVGEVKPTFVLLGAAVGLVLLIAIANVANLMLARGIARTRELAVRAALGAQRGRLARQLLTESALLGVLGGAFGLAIAWLLVSLVARQAGEVLPRADEVRVDTMVITFALTTGILASVAAGIVPVLWLTWGRLAAVLRDSGRAVSEAPRQGRARRILVAGEVALALTVLIGTGLLIKTAVRLHSADPGFRPDGALSFYLQLPADPYGDAERAETFWTTIEARLRGLPAVSSVASGSSLPPDRLQLSNNYTLEGEEQGQRGRSEQGSGVAAWMDVSPDYFSALGIPVKRGRAFTTSDRDQAPPVAIVSETFARRHFPDENVLGKRFKGGNWNPEAPWTTIVGVAGDVPYERGVWGGMTPAVYVPFAQNRGSRSRYVVLTATADPNSLVAAVRQAVLDVDKALPVRNVASMEDRLWRSTATPRLRGLLFSLLGSVALVLAITGIYGVVAYHVNQRRRDTAIRRALGAPSAQIVGAVVGSGIRLTAMGIAAGLAGGFVASRSLSGFLYDVQPSDPGVFVIAASALVVAALVASLVPAIRAVRSDPLASLREE